MTTHWIYLAPVRMAHVLPAGFEHSWKNGCFNKLGVPFVRVLVTRASILFGVHIC